MKQLLIALVLSLSLMSCAGPRGWPTPEPDTPCAKCNMAPWVWSKDATGLKDAMRKRQAIDSLKQRIPLPSQYRSNTQKAL